MGAPSVEGETISFHFYVTIIAAPVAQAVSGDHVGAIRPF
jgi:hypothetical protein